MNLLSVFTSAFLCFAFSRHIQLVNVVIPRISERSCFSSTRSPKSLCRGMIHECSQRTQHQTTWLLAVLIQYFLGCLCAPALLGLPSTEKCQRLHSTVYVVTRPSRGYHQFDSSQPFWTPSHLRHNCKIHIL